MTTIHPNDRVTPTTGWHQDKIGTVQEIKDGPRPVATVLFDDGSTAEMEVSDLEKVIDES